MLDDVSAGESASSIGHWLAVQLVLLPSFAFFLSFFMERSLVSLFSYRTGQPMHYTTMMIDGSVCLSLLFWFLVTSFVFIPTLCNT